MGLAMTAACTMVRPVAIAPTPAVLTPSSTVPVTTSGLYHRVEKGQTLWQVAKAYNVELDQLVQANRLPDASKLEVGQLIFVPSVIEGRARTPGASRVSFDPNGFVWPVQGKVVTHFGSRRGLVANKGIDIEAHAGAAVKAARAGRVAFSDEQLRGYGKTVIIDHGDDFSTVYAHNELLLVRVGQRLQQGEVIAKMGATGHAAAPVLYFEIRKAHRPQNPMYYLP